jgi:hypothetical protein
MGFMNDSRFGDGEQRIVKVTEVNAANHRVVVEDNYGTILYITLHLQDAIVSMPVPGEKWVAERQGVDWFLEKRVESGDETTPLTSMAPGDKRVEANTTLHLNAPKISIQGEIDATSISADVIAATSLSAKSGSFESLSVAALATVFANDYFSVKDFGARGDGTTDDTAAIAAALTAASAKGGVVFFPSGSYRITSTLRIAAGTIALLGEGFASKILFNGSTVGTAIAMADTTQRTNILISNLRITSSTSGQGLGIDASHFAICRFSNLSIDGPVNAGIDFNSADTFYNFVDNVRLSIGGTGSFGIRIQNGANENTILRARIITDALATGAIIDAHSNELYSLDVETGALLGVDIRANAHATLLNAPYLEANQTNLQLASGVQAFTCIGGTIESATTANITDNGAVSPSFVGTRLQFASLSQLPATNFNAGLTPTDAVLLAQSAPGSLGTRDSHNLNLRGGYHDGANPHTVDWRVVNNVTTTTGGSKIRFMSRADAGTFAEKLSVDGSGVVITGGRVIAGGPVQTPFAAKTAAYSVVANTDSILTGDATTATFQFTLPTAASIQGRSFTIKRINSGANNVTIGTTSAQTIDGAATKTLGSQWAFVTVTSDGSNWLITSQGGTVT